MFRIAEEYTKTIKKNPDEKYFFIMEKFDFEKFSMTFFFEQKIFFLEKKSNIFGSTLDPTTKYISMLIATPNIAQNLFYMETPL